MKTSLFPASRRQRCEKISLLGSVITGSREQSVVRSHYDFSQPTEAPCDVMMELAMLKAADAVRTSAELTSAELLSGALAGGLPGCRSPLRWPCPRSAVGSVQLEAPVVRLCKCGPLILW